MIIDGAKLTYETSVGQLESFRNCNNDGLLIPVNEGSAELSVTWQGKTDKCTVTVYSEGRVPSIKTDRDSIGFLLSDEPIVVTAYVLFGNKKYKILIGLFDISQIFNSLILPSYLFARPLTFDVWTLEKIPLSCKLAKPLSNSFINCWV